MAIHEQLAILKQGVEVWNKWREEHSDTGIDLSDAQLLAADLSGANLAGADLRRVDLKRASLIRTDLNAADLSEADLSTAYLRGADLRRTALKGAALRGANLSAANLSLADMRQTTLDWANLVGTVFHATRVDGASFSEAVLEDTVFIRTDLSRVFSLETCHHQGPSTLGTNTLAASRGRIPEAFLRGCGLSDWEIEFGEVVPARPPQPGDHRHELPGV